MKCVVSIDVIEVVDLVCDELVCSFLNMLAFSKILKKYDKVV